MALSTQVRASSGSALPWKHDVFLSFRGADTRKGFTDHLYDKLQWRGIRTFRDDPQLERGTAISLELLTAIKQSRFAIVVLSPNYASSTWCLLELSKILECMEERGRILPIFYGVDPSDVRHQRGSFAEAFQEHEEKFGVGNEEVGGWRDALTKVASLAGWTSKDYRYETQIIKEIVQELWSKVHPSLTVFGSSEKLFGMDTKWEEIDVLLDKEANDVRFIGIWGMGGMGKTTLARLVYEKISYQFDVCIFLDDVRKAHADHGLVYLQKQILSQLLKEENVQVWNVYSGITMIERYVCNKAVLLVLDNVDQSEQLEKLVGEKDWFGLRSRIIITTRNQLVLVTHGVEKPYELKGLNSDEALQLFSWKAFRKYEPEVDYVEHSMSFVRYAGGHPLALKTLGSLLYNKRSLHSWSSALAKLQNTPDKTVFDLLKVSYDGLDKMEKKIFLDIACFRRLYGDESMIEQVYKFEFSFAIDVLADRSLITISRNHIYMHDLIRQMGCEIVRQENEEPGRRSRLWLRNDIFHVFTKNTGTEAIEGILLDLAELEEADWNLEGFSKMPKLKLLYIHNLRLSVGPKFLPNGLRFLRWSWYPSKSLPPCFQPDELTELSLVHSNITHLWNGKKSLGNLKSLDLSFSTNLTRTPDFTGVPNLEKLDLDSCTNLVEIHPSIALLKRLKIWIFCGCRSIKSLPGEVHMEFLETFDASDCSKLKMTPDFTGIPNLEKLYLDGCTNLVEIHPSIALLKRLKIWTFSHCKSIKSLPGEVYMEFLETFDASGCSKLKMIPEFVGQTKRLSTLWLSGTAVEKLPSSIEHLGESLKELHLSEIVIREQPYSRFLKQNLIASSLGLFPRTSPHPLIPVLASLKHLSSLMALYLNYCKLCEGEIPNDIGSLSSLEWLELRGNNFVSLPASIHLLSKLLCIDVENCERLKQLPELPANVDLEVITDNCTSLQVFPDPPVFGALYAVNCLSTVGNQDASYFIYSVLKQWVEAAPGSAHRIEIVIPGSEIPEWFNNQSVGGLVTENLPSDACNSKWIGFAVCALFVPQDNLSYFSCGYRLLSVKQIASDHLFLFFEPSRFWKPENCLEDTCNEVKFVLGTNPRSHIKKCGARALYEHDVEELISKMNQSKSSSISLYEAVDEQEGAMVKATRGSNKRKWCSDDEYYYSAEED